MTAEERTTIDNVLKDLKNFQLATVNEAYKSLFKKGGRKILIADEVGLGKTIVAKGIIAKAYGDFLENNALKKKRFHVIYICSNQALAQQNLQKLNFTNNHSAISTPINRLTYLAFNLPSDLPKFCISTLTPGTSFKLTKGKGYSSERAIIFALLTEYQCFYNYMNGILWILKGSSDIVNWKSRANEYYKNRYNYIRKELFQIFRKTLREYIVTEKELRRTYEAIGKKEGYSIWDALLQLSKEIDGRNEHNYYFQSEIIGKLRYLLSQTCLTYLDADLFILDEFQRYKELIDSNKVTPASILAKAVFDLPDSKVIMLSATPFKPYTSTFDIDSGEEHYAEFKTVLEFLYDNKKNAFWDNFEIKRKEFFQLLRRPKDALENEEKSLILKKELESIYRKFILRTERLIVSKDYDSMIVRKNAADLRINQNDIIDFIHADQLINELNEVKKKSIQSPIEYCKSAPFPLSFLENYKIRETLKYLRTDIDTLSILKKYRKPWLNLHDINHYKAIPFDHHSKEGFPNAKLRMLIEEAVFPHGWKLLWVTPTIPFYELTGAYKGTEYFSKTIVFSSWLMVPKMISTIASYEAERLTIGNKKAIAERDKRRYFQEKKKEKRIPRPQLVFSTDKSSRTPNNMNNFCLLYPSLTLANLYNPQSNIIEKKGLSEIRRTIKSRISDLIKKYNLKQYENSSGKKENWYWAAPVILDKLNNEYSKTASDFISGMYFRWSKSSDPEAVFSDSEESNSKENHKGELLRCFNNPSEIDLGKMPSDLADTLTDMVLGSPAICSLRVLCDYSDSLKDCLHNSFKISLSFLSLFNKPESICLVRIFNPEGVFYRNVLKYCVSGNIQSMIDEFAYLLWDCENYRHVNTLSEHICDVMNIRTTAIKVDDLNSFIKKENKTMRCHYAIAYGTQEIETNSGVKRSVSVRQTFNSPFRPFILSTTSIGQEGLDFHYYCKRIFHWNLPSNAIDIEQREGRINRYKGLVIRQNISDKYKKMVTSDLLSEYLIWDTLFDIALNHEQKNEPCELVPFWYIQGNPALKIERFVPIHPYSKDKAKYRHLLKVLALYRLTFGQPRQEELLEALLNENLTSDEILKIRSLLMINLSPFVK